MTNVPELSKGPITTETPIRIFLVEDHELLRAGMRMLIEGNPDYQICGEAAGESEAMEKVRKLHPGPHLVIVDLTLRSGGGLDLIKRLNSHNPNIRVLIASMHDERLYGARALRAGALGYVNKQAPAETLFTAITCVLSGKLYFSEEFTTRMLRGEPEAKAKEFSLLDRLSDRELEIFQMIGEGLSTAAIAQKIHLSPSTVGTYRERLKTKLNLANSRELTHLAMQWAIQKSDLPRPESEA